MQDTEQDKSVKEEKKDKDPRRLIGTKTYGLGVMAKYSLIFVATLTGALTLFAMTVTKAGGQGLRNREKLIEKIKWLPEKMETWWNKANDKRGHRLEGLFPVVGASFLLAHFAKYALQIPAFERGRRQAVHANEKYAEVVDERDELLDKLAKYEGEPLTASHTPSQAQQQAAIPQVIAQTPPQAMMQRPAASPVVPPLGQVHNPTSATTTMGGASILPSVGFAAEHKPPQTHAVGVQDSKNTPPLVGAGV